MERYERPLKLKTNKIPYLIPGGGLIERFLGEAGTDGEEPISQMWIASVVQCVLEGARDSRSLIVEEGGEERCLAEELAKEPEHYLGGEFCRRFGATPGFLLKLLNSRDRLLVQTHPDKEKALRYFHSPFGKTECWYVLDTEPEACIWAGFRPGVTKERFRELILKQDIEGILNCLHRFFVRRGDVVFIPAGLPHALGKGSLIAEIQEPTDITLRAERFRPDGSELPEESLHSGIGYDGLLDCFAFDCAEEDTVRERIFLKPDCSTYPWGEEERLIGYEDTPCFAMNRIFCKEKDGECRRENKRFAVALVVSGSGWIEYGLKERNRIRLEKGCELFLPHGLKEYRYIPDGEMEILECYPPR